MNLRRAPALHTLPESASIADRLTWDLSDSDPWVRAWRYKKFAEVPSMLAESVGKQYVKFWNDKGYRDANYYLLDVTDRLSGLCIDPRSSDDDLVELARKIACRCREILRESVKRGDVAVALIGICNRYGVRPPANLMDGIGYRYGNGNGIRISIRNGNGNGNRYVPAPQSANHVRCFLTPNGDRKKVRPVSGGVISRLTDDVWWRRKLRVVHSRILEAEAIYLHQVHRFAGMYVSQATYVRYRQQRDRNIRVLRGLVAIDEFGNERELSDLSEKSLANPSNRRAELMVRIYGFDQIAVGHKHDALLLTITCPSRMHPHLASSGAENPAYDGSSTPRTSQQYLTKLWRQIRAKLHRDGIRPYGFRIAEPHQDGTPHWHILAFIDQECTKRLITTIRDYALRDNPDEPGAWKHRFSVERIDRTKGSATAYVAKYISKNIDGFGLDNSEDGEPERKLANRVTAWASTWGIRQFQQIGGPPVGLWREFRRVPALGTNPGLIGELAKAADEACWERFVDALGGPQQRRASLPIGLEKVYDMRPGQYGEPIGNRVVGVRQGNVVFSTRFTTWQIRRKHRDRKCTRGNDSNSGIAVSGRYRESSVVALPPWSSVNNCTDHHELLSNAMRVWCRIDLSDSESSSVHLGISEDRNASV